jgi:hypothetical protein
MNLGKKLPPASKNDKRMLAASSIIFLAAVVIAVLVLVNRNTPRPSPTTIDINGNSVDVPVGTLLPGMSGSSEIIKQLTAMPNAAALTGALADDVHAVAQMVSSCNDYSQARRIQMNQHIAWLLQPNTLPKDVIIALNSNINGGLIMGMATYTLAEWGQHAKAPDSCLLAIGKKLNDMLAATGKARFTEFDRADG